MIFHPHDDFVPGCTRCMDEALEAREYEMVEHVDVVEEPPC